VKNQGRSYQTRYPSGYTRSTVRHIESFPMRIGGFDRRGMFLSNYSKNY
jgi:hypothetical protein